MTVSKLIIGFILLIAAAGAMANGLGLSEAQLNSLLNPGATTQSALNPAKSAPVNNYGTKIQKNGVKYVGQFKDGDFHGQGTWTWKGNKYVGQFKDGDFHGQGVWISRDGNRYVGQFKNNKRHGQGTNTFANGSKQVGQFVNNEYQGQKKNQQATKQAAQQAAAQQAAAQQAAAQQAAAEQAAAEQAAAEQAAAEQAAAEQAAAKQAAQARAASNNPASSSTPKNRTGDRVCYDHSANGANGWCGYITAIYDSSYRVESYTVFCNSGGLFGICTNLTGGGRCFGGPERLFTDTGGQSYSNPRQLIIPKWCVD